MLAVTLCLFGQQSSANVTGTPIQPVSEQKSQKSNRQFLYEHWNQATVLMMQECRFDTSVPEMADFLSTAKLWDIAPEEISMWVILLINEDSIVMNSTVLASNDAFKNYSSQKLFAMNGMLKKVFSVFCFKDVSLDWCVIDDSHIKIDGDVSGVNGEGLLFNYLTPLVKPTYFKVLKKTPTSAQLGMISSVFSNNSSPLSMMASVGFVNPDLNKHYHVSQSVLDENRGNSSNTEEKVAAALAANPAANPVVQYEATPDPQQTNNRTAENPTRPRAASAQIVEGVPNEDLAKMKEAGKYVEPHYMSGGVQSFYDWIGTQIRYPQDALDDGICGKVSYQFTVNEDGTLSNIYLIRTVDKSLNEEVVRAVLSSRRWEPAKLNGKPTKATYTGFVIFSPR